MIRLGAQKLKMSGGGWGGGGRQPHPTMIEKTDDSIAAKYIKKQRGGWGGRQPPHDD